MFGFVRRKNVALALGATVLLAACSDASAAQQASTRVNAWTTPHVFTISDAGDVNTLNLATEVPTRTNGGISTDGRTITYHIRKGAVWSDGAPFDADDVVFSTSVINDMANNEAGRFDQIERVDEPDKCTVVYHLKKPYSPSTVAFFSSSCANPCLLPKHLLASYPNINDVPYNALPVGIRPFKFERWDRSKQVVMSQIRSIGTGARNSIRSSTRSCPIVTL